MKGIIKAQTKIDKFGKLLASIEMKIIDPEYFAINQISCWRNRDDINRKRLFYLADQKL